MNLDINHFYGISDSELEDFCKWCDSSKGTFLPSEIIKSHFEEFHHFNENKYPSLDTAVAAIEARGEIVLKYYTAWKKRLSRKGILFYEINLLVQHFMEDNTPPGWTGGEEYTEPIDPSFTDVIEKYIVAAERKSSRKSRTFLDVMREGMGVSK